MDLHSSGTSSTGGGGTDGGEAGTWLPVLGGAAAALARDDLDGVEVLLDDVTDVLTYTLLSVSAAAQLSARPELVWWVGEDGALDLLVPADAPACRRLLVDAVAARVDLDFARCLDLVLDAFDVGDPVVEITRLFATLVEALAVVTDAAIDDVAVEICLAFAR